MTDYERTARVHHGSQKDETPTIKDNIPNMNDALMVLTTDFADDINWTCSENSTRSEYIPYVQRPETYIVPVVFAIVFIVGLIGNGTLILIFLQNKRLRNVPNIYILSLAMGDFVVICGAVPFISTIYTFESWPYGEFLCKLSEFIRDVSIGVTVMTLTLLSADRYVAIVSPMKKHKGRRAKTVTVVTAITVWCVAAAIATPGAYYSFLWKVKVNPTKFIKVCYPFPENMLPWYPKVMVLMKFLLLYLIPLVLIASFYVLMARHLILTSRKMLGQNETQIKQMRARAKVAKVVLTFVVIFAVSFFPNQVFMMWYYYHPYSNDYYNNFWHVLKIMGYILSFSNSCLNPIALYFIGGQIRGYYKNYLCCYCYWFKREHMDGDRVIDCTLTKNNTASFRIHSRKSSKF